MFPETSRCLKAAAPVFSQTGFSMCLRRLQPHGGGSSLQARRHLAVSGCLTAKVSSPRKPRIRVEIPGLEMVTYSDRMHYMQHLTKPVFPRWERDYKDPRHYHSPPMQEMPLYKEKPCYIFTQRTSALEGVRQALWLTKSKLIPRLPPQLLSLAERCNSEFPNQDERVKNTIEHARFWDTTQERPGKLKYSNTLLSNLLHLCATLQSSHPALGRRIFNEKYSLAAPWKRGDDLFQVRGQNGLLLSSMDPLPEISGKQEVSETANNLLETFYPVSPTICLQKVHIYKEDENCTGFTSDYPYRHPHTLFFLEKDDVKWTLRPDQFRTKMIMFAFGNALAYARTLDASPRVLDHPITIQSVGTNGRFFQFLVFQLNTTDLSGDDGIKNQVWLEEDLELYDYAKVRPLIKKKQVKVPAGLAGYKPETFSKFLALYLHGVL
ncbi:large ribosomal subunit protein mL37 [Aulostomus maculatus]